MQAIRIVEHEEFFSHTAEERLIYRQACHDHHILESEAAYQGASLDAKEALLKRCAHFSLDMEACDATAAVRLLGARKRARIQSLQKQLEMEACRAVHLKSWDVSKAGLLEGVHHPEAKLFLQKIHGATSAFWAQKHDFKASLELLLDLYDKDGQPRLRPEGVSISRCVKPISISAWRNGTWCSIPWQRLQTTLERSRSWPKRKFARRCATGYLLKMFKREGQKEGIL